MVFSMSLSKLKQVMVLATVFATISCLDPESAQARLRFSGVSNFIPESDISEIKVDFVLGDNFEGSIEGFFPRAILSFKSIANPLSNSPKPLLSCFYGDLKASQIRLNFNDSLIEQLHLDERFTDNDVFKYEGTFSNISEECPSGVELTFLTPSTENLKQLSQVPGKVRIPIPEEFGGSPGLFVDAVYPLDGVPLDVIQVPEPVTTSSLLSFGALGTASLLKRRRHSK